MGKTVVMAIVVLLLAVCCGNVMAQPTGHYPLGAEGIKAATLPPPGLYFKNYMYYYDSSVYRKSSLAKALGMPDTDLDFDVDAFVYVPRLVWISDQKILGGYFGADVLMTLVYNDVEIDTFAAADKDFGLGDICIEPITLSWHGEQWDAGVGAAVWVPSGQYDEDNIATPGKDFWTTMFTFGGTLYFDEEKTISASALSRYEIHSEADHLDYRPGNNMVVEWGVAKTFCKTVDVGVVGYCQWQLTDDHGPDATWDTDVHDRVAAVGPEVSVFIPEIKTFISGRVEWEFSAVDRTEGTTAVVTVTKMF